MSLVCRIVGFLRPRGVGMHHVFSAQNRKERIYGRVKLYRNDSIYHFTCTHLAPAPQDSKRTLRYQDLRNADRLLNKNSVFSGFSTRNIRADLPRNDQWLLHYEFPSPWGGKGRLYIFWETTDAKQLFDIYLNHWKRRALIAIGGFIWIWGCLRNREARFINKNTFEFGAY